MSNETTVELIPIPAEVLALLHRILDQNNEILKINTQLLEELVPSRLVYRQPELSEEVLKNFRGSY